MSVEIVKIVPCDSRNTLCRYRDGFKAMHGVSVFFPKSRVHGANQGMVLKGGPSGIAVVEREVEKVLSDWRVEFEGFLDRRRWRRADSRTRPIFPVVLKDSKDSTELKASKDTNMFALLDPDEELTCPEVVSVEVPVVKPRRVQLTGWSVVVAKPATAAKGPLAEKVRYVDEDEGWSTFEVERAAGVVDSNTSWGDFASM
jgi:hypothetical protein